ncbi:hypothetical protein LDENG_00239320, partial [Lucifuga dentata]
ISFSCLSLVINKMTDDVIRSYLWKVVMLNSLYDAKLKYALESKSTTRQEHT